MAKLTTKEIKLATEIFNKMDREDSDMLIHIWKTAQSNRSAMAAAQFKKGDLVQFTNRAGQKVTGSVSKVNRKTVAVETTTGGWKVSPSLLTLVA